MNTAGRKPGSLVGAFLRQRRESLGLSQRELGQRFSPSVTTQFISNIERGVTPLPPAQISTLSRELGISETELLSLMEREYLQKLNDRLHPEDASGVTASTLRNLTVDQKDAEFMRAVYQAYTLSDRQTQENFENLCQKILRMTK